jgi:hypothetical protein
MENSPQTGEERIAHEFLLKLGVQVSPRTVRKYMPEHPSGGPHGGTSDQHWTTFVNNHAQAIVACDFFTVVTATFKVLYVFVLIEHASLTEWIGHLNTARPHSALGPGIPDPPIGMPAKLRGRRHDLPPGAQLTSRAVLRGLHHEYPMQPAA